MIALTFDCEQWNCPLLEHRKSNEPDTIKYSMEGNEKLLEILNGKKVRATFFITSFFAEKKSDQIKKIAKLGHEIASHSHCHYYRGNNKLNITDDIRRSKEILEKIIGRKIRGFRSPQLQYSSLLAQTLKGLGFDYDSSLHPTYLPGCYSNISAPREPFRPLQGSNFLEIPLTVSPLAIPTGWVFTRVLGINRTINICKNLIKQGKVPVLYFHSWEFYPMKSREVPFYYNWRTGEWMISALERLIDQLGSDSFITMSELADRLNKD